MVGAKAVSNGEMSDCNERLNEIPEAEFMDEIQTKILRFFLLAIHHSHLYSQQPPWDLYFFKLTQPLTVSAVQLL